MKLFCGFCPICIIILIVLGISSYFTLGILGLTLIPIGYIIYKKLAHKHK